MGSLYKGVDLFGSGPHRFVVRDGRRRIIAQATVTGNVLEAGTFESGNYELRVEVVGRLVAADDLAMWALRDAIVAESQWTVGSGVLEDHFGHQWLGMKLLKFEASGAVDRGRELSLGYIAEFGVLLTS